MPKTNGMQCSWNRGTGFQAVGVQATAPGSGPLGSQGVALAVTGKVLGVFPELVEFQLEV